MSPGILAPESVFCFKDFLEKLEVRWRERNISVTAKHWWAASCMPPSWDWAHNPDWLSNRWPFCAWEDEQPTEPHQSGPESVLMLFIVMQSCLSGVDFTEDFGWGTEGVTGSGGLADCTVEAWNCTRVITFTRSHLVCIPGRTGSTMQEWIRLLTSGFCTQFLRLRMP